MCVVISLGRIPEKRAAESRGDWVFQLPNTCLTRFHNGCALPSGSGEQGPLPLVRSGTCLAWRVSRRWAQGPTVGAHNSMSPRFTPYPQELEKCDANHYIILFRDAGCQFRALYCYYPDTEEICKLTGTGPKSIAKKMIDKLYKYSSDRKQFSLIPAKTMSVSVDALTIHNHLWQPKRPSAPKKTQTRK